MAETLIILGVCARGAAVSARAAGYEPVSVDLFADLDTKAAGKAIQIQRFPEDFLAALRACPDAPWMYTGGLENYPNLIEQLAAARPLLGNHAAVLRQVRDPLSLSRVLTTAGLRYPSPGNHQNQNVKLPRVFKPLRSGGGRGVHLVPAFDACSVPAGWYEQRYVEGCPASALYVAASGRFRLLGTSRQLIGGEFGAPEPFGYVGSIGLLQVNPHLESELNRIGAVLAERFALRGIFGVDLVLQGDRAWVVEVNPRITASADVVERATGCSSIALHVAACKDGELEPPTWSASVSNGLHAKAVIYARAACRAGERLLKLAEELNSGPVPLLADIPCHGTCFEATQPIATVFGCRDTEEEVLEELRALRDKVLEAVDGI